MDWPETKSFLFMENEFLLWVETQANILHYLICVWCYAQLITSGFTEAGWHPVMSLLGKTVVPKEQNLLKVDVWVINYLSGKLVLPQSSSFVNIDL